MRLMQRLMRRGRAASGFTVAVALGACKGSDAPRPDTAVTGMTSTVAPAAPRPDPATTTAPLAPAAGGAPSAPGARTLSVDPSASRIGFTASKLTGSHSGGFEQFAGQASLVGAELRALSFEVDTGSLESDAEKLTEHLKSKDFLDVQRYPKATFASTSITATPGAAGTHTVTGDLTLHGVTQRLTFPVQIHQTADALTGQAEITIDRQKFGVTYPGMPDDLIKDEVVLKPVFVFRSR